MLLSTCADAGSDNTTDSAAKKTRGRLSDLTDAFAHGHFMMRLCTTMSTISKVMSPCAWFPTLSACTPFCTGTHTFSLNTFLFAATGAHTSQRETSHAPMRRQPASSSNPYAHLVVCCSLLVASVPRGQCAVNTYREQLALFSSNVSLDCRFTCVRHWVGGSAT